MLSKNNTLKKKNFFLTVDFLWKINSIVKTTLKVKTITVHTFVPRWILFCVQFIYFETLRQICGKNRIIKHIHLQCAVKVGG